VTARKEYERNCEKRRSSRALGLLAGGIAHDFNNLLVPVSATPRSCWKTPAWTNGARSVCGYSARGPAGRGIERQMLAYAGRAPFQVTTFDLIALTVELLGLLRVSLKPGVELRRISSRKLPAIRGEPTQVRQVVLNCCSTPARPWAPRPAACGYVRALDAAPGLLADAVINGVRDDCASVMLEVEDTGCGMDDATRRGFSTTFFTTKFIGRGRARGGARHRAGACRGALKVYSRLGAGSRFQVYFPASAEPAPVVAPPARRLAGPRAGCW
jgi:hypothetical protein